jgi:1-acyl-sn-glycerol-3-phosphate acyltransferase
MIATLVPTIRRAMSAASAWLYAGYWWTVLCAFGAVVWPLVVLLPRLSWRWALLHPAARLMLRVQGIPLSIHIENPPPLRDAIIAVNHSSYFDGAPLLAALSGEPIIAIAREFASHPFVGPFLKGLNALFVERLKSKSSIEDTERAAALARAGQLLVFFPEATYARGPGLAEFYLGAFLVAAQTGRPIVPVVIRGTRSVLRGEHWFPRRGPISVWVGAPIHPEGGDFHAAVALRDHVRDTILARTGEPDLAPTTHGPERE